MYYTVPYKTPPGPFCSRNVWQVERVMVATRTTTSGPMCLAVQMLLRRASSVKENCGLLLVRLFEEGAVDQWAGSRGILRG